MGIFVFSLVSLVWINLNTWIVFVRGQSFGTTNSREKSN